LGVILDHLRLENLDEVVPCKVINLSGNHLTNMKKILTKTNLTLIQDPLVHCHNLNIGFTTNCEVQWPMRPKVCLGVKHIFTNGGECKGSNPKTFKCIPILRITLVQEF